MSLWFAHELGLALAMSLALLSVLLGGELHQALWLTMLTPWLGMFLRFRKVEVSNVLGTVLALAAFAWAGLLLLNQGLDGSMLAAAIALLGIVAARLLTRRTPNHDLQALVLSLLLVFAGTVLHQQFTYGVVFVFYAVTVTWALITRQLVAGAELEAERKGPEALRNSMARRDVVTPTFFGVTGVVALAILLSTSILFVLFPRVGLGSLALRGRNGGRMPNDVSLLGTPRAIQGGTQVVARVYGVGYRAFLDGLYLRGTVYDALDATGFRRSGPLLELPRHKLALAPTANERDYEVFLEPVTDQVLLTLGPAHAWRVVSGGYANPSARARIVGTGPADELLTDAVLTGALRYGVHGGISTSRSTLDERALPPQVEPPGAGSSDAVFAQHFLKLPDHLDPRIAPLAQSLAGTLASHGAKAAALRRFLLRQFTYTLSQPNAGKADPLASFLFDERRGHCEYFATAFAVLLRAVGVPSRVVGGFASGSWDEEGQVVVFTGANAHAWVEWYEPGRGWIVDDATPADGAATLTGPAAWLERLRRAWDDQVVEFGFEQQMDLLSSMASALRSPSLPTDQQPWKPVAAGVLGVAIVAGAWWLGRLRWTPRRRIAPLTKALVEGIERVSGAPLPHGATLREAVERSQTLGLTQRDSALLWQALACYEAVRFGYAGQLAVPRQLLVGLRRLPKASAPGSARGSATARPGIRPHDAAGPDAS